MSHHLLVEDFVGHSTEIPLASAYGKSGVKRLNIEIDIVTLKAHYVVHEREKVGELAFETRNEFQTLEEAIEYYNGEIYA